MFVAENSAGVQINLLEHTKVTRQMTNQQTNDKEYYRCPCCKKEVILKKGTVIRPHFAHKKKEACVLFLENETPEHLAGKALLVKSCQQTKRAHQLEAYIPELQQRVDVLVGNWALEFQCSSLSLSRLAERVTGYQRYGLNDIWLLGKQFKLKKRLSALQRAFIRTAPQLGNYIWHLDVFSERVFLFYHIEERLATRELFYSSKVMELNTFFTQLAQLENLQKISFYQIRRFDLIEHDYLLRQFFYQKLIRKDPEILKVQGFLYTLHASLDSLHPFFLLPVISRVAFYQLLKGKVIIWQKLMQTKKIEINKISDFLSQELVATPHLLEEIKSWIELLEKWGIVQKNKETLQLRTNLPLTLSKSAHKAFMDEKLKSVAFDSCLPQKYDMIESIRK